MKPERFRAPRHLLDELGPAERRHRMAAPGRRFERVAARTDPAVDVARLTRDADFVLDFVIVGLELVVIERPVLDSRPFRNPRCAIPPRRLAHDFEIPRIETP